MILTAPRHHDALTTRPSRKHAGTRPTPTSADRVPKHQEYPMCEHNCTSGLEDMLAEQGERIAKSTQSTTADFRNGFAFALEMIADYFGEAV